MKRLLGWLCLMLVQAVLYAQDMKTVFINLPDSLSPLLTKVNREDFGDFLASNMKAEVKNRFGKPSEMLKLTDDYLLLRVSSASVTEMKLLPLNDSVKIVCVVQTYSAPAADSRVSFFDTSWCPLRAEDYLSLPEEEVFYRQPATDGQADTLRNLRVRADMYLLKAELSADSPVLSFTYTTPDYLDEETANLLKPYLRPESLRYEWKGGRFAVSETLPSDLKR